MSICIGDLMMLQVLLFMDMTLVGVIMVTFLQKINLLSFLVKILLVETFGFGL